MLHIDDAANMISKEGYGIHYIIVYPDLETLKKFYYFYLQNQMAPKSKGITLIAPFYETTDSVRQSLADDADAEIGVSHSENTDKTLLLVDAYHHYFGRGVDLQEQPARVEKKGGGGKEGLSISEENLIEDARRRGFEGFSVLLDAGPYPFAGRHRELVDYELLLPTKFSLKIKRICLYHKKDFDTFRSDQKQKLIEHHGMAIELLK
jgi:hypothetical protein